MKYCSTCGAELHDDAVICPKCGCMTAEFKQTKLEDKSSTGLNILSFLIPLVGLILYLVYIEKQPIKAKACGKWALISFILNIAIIFINSLTY